MESEFTLNYSSLQELQASVSQEDFMKGLALPIKAQAWLISLYSLTILLSFTGNLLVLVVLSFGNRTKKDLTKYLLSLALADLCMTCFCMPFTFTKVMLGRWVFGAFLCPTVLFMQVASVTASIYTNVAIGIDRYLAVTCPLRQRVTKTKTPLVIGVIWCAAIGLASVQLFIAKAQTRSFHDIQYHNCGEVWTTYRDRNIFNLFMLFMTYLLPLVILIVSYYKVIIILWRRETPGNADITRDEIRLKSKRKVIQMLIIIVLLFMLCWLPIQLFILIVDLAPSILDDINTSSDEHIYLGVFYVCHWIAMAHSFMNPIIYCFLNESFRVDLRYLIRHNRCRKQCCPCLYIDFGGAHPESTKNSSQRNHYVYRNATDSSSSSHHKTSREIPAQACKCTALVILDNQDNNVIASEL